MCSKYSTPDLTHLSGEDYNCVYEPAEDSFLFLDALEHDADVLKELNPQICVEFGCGSGVILTFLASILQGKSCFYLGIDINPLATKATSRTLRANGVNTGDAVCDDLFLSTITRLKGNVDMILFNPPYVPTPSDEVGVPGIVASWAGGKNGREVVDRFLPTVSTLLSDMGVLYLLLLKENKPEEICAILEGQGFMSETILTRRTGPEYLMVLRFQRTAVSGV